MNVIYVDFLLLCWTSLWRVSWRPSDRIFKSSQENLLGIKDVKIFLMIFCHYRNFDKG